MSSAGGVSGENGTTARRRRHAGLPSPAASAILLKSREPPTTLSHIPQPTTRGPGQMALSLPVSPASRLRPSSPHSRLDPPYCSLPAPYPSFSLSLALSFEAIFVRCPSPRNCGDHGLGAGSELRRNTSTSSLCACPSLCTCCWLMDGLYAPRRPRHTHHSMRRRQNANCKSCVCPCQIPPPSRSYLQLLFHYAAAAASATTAFEMNAAPKLVPKEKSQNTSQYPKISSPVAPRRSRTAALPPYGPWPWNPLTSMHAQSPPSCCHCPVNLSTTTHATMTAAAAHPDFT